MYLHGCQAFAEDEATSSILQRPLVRTIATTLLDWLLCYQVWRQHQHQRALLHLAVMLCKSSCCAVSVVQWSASSIRIRLLMPMFICIWQASWYTLMGVIYTIGICFTQRVKF